MLVSCYRLYVTEVCEVIAGMEEVCEVRASVEEDCEVRASVKKAMRKST